MARFKRILKWTGIVIGSLAGLLILLAVLVSIFGGDGDDSQADDSMAKPTPTPIAVTANTLEREHEANEATWESKYVDNFALITGTIDSITETGNKYDVKLETDNFTVDIVCKVDKADESTVLSLRQSQTVSVLGRVTDDGILDIVVKDCSIASSSVASQPAGQAQTTAPATSLATPATTLAATASPTATPTPTTPPIPAPTPIVVTANALEREHEANEVYWEDKYVGKYVLITGSINSITEAGSQYDVKLSTDNLWVNVVCKVSHSGRSSVLELAKGEIVTVHGLVTNAGIIDIVVRDCAIRPPQSVSGEEREQAPADSSAATSVPRPTATPNPTLTHNPFAQYQGMAKNAAVITVYVGTPTGSGSGFLYRVDDSERFVILTNSHVVQDYSSVEVCWALVQECIYEQVQNRGSENFDVAVIEFSQFLEHGLDAETLQWFATWYESHINSSESRINGWAKGDVVYASGYPGGHKVQGTDIISDPVVTEGIIASDRLASYRGKAYFIEHGANIEPGSSGGPLMNNAASIVGINTGTNLLTEQLELAIPMFSIREWLETGEEPSLIRTPGG